MMKYCFGVDVGGTTVKLGLFTVEGELLDKWEIKTYTGAGTPTPMPQISSALRSFSAIFPLIASATSGRIRSPSFSV